MDLENAKTAVSIVMGVITILGSIATYAGYEAGNKNKEQAVQKIIIVKDSQIAGIANAYHEVCK